METALLVINFGGPQRAQEVEGFLFELFRDKDVIPLPGGSYLQEVFADVVSSRRAPRIVEQYAQIGGGSPLTPMTYRQVDALRQALAERGHTPAIHVGMRYTKPTIATALQAIKDQGAQRLVCLALYPHFSFATTGSSFNEVARAMRRLGLEKLPTSFVSAWHDHPGYVQAQVERVRAALEGAPPGTHIMFSAHGLPVSFIQRGDPYQQQVQQNVRDVIQALGWEGPYSLAFQSKVGPSRWLSPATDDELRRLGAAGTPAVVVVPVSFVGDHIETLFELDIEYRHVAHQAGLHDYRRAGALDLHPRFIDALADVAAKALGEPRGRSCVRCLLPRDEEHLRKPQCPDCNFRQPDFMRR